MANQMRMANPYRDTEIPQNTNMADYILNCNREKMLIYLRFGEKYLNDMEKRKNSLSGQGVIPTSMATASYLINVKKLIDEHNIKGDKRDFKSLKGQNMSKKLEIPKEFY